MTVEIGEWEHEKKSYVLFRVVNTAKGILHLNEVMLRIINNDTDVCVCATCMLDRYLEIKETRVSVEWYAFHYDKKLADN
jgi:hypothetical protein